jgi:hypothetical protein
MSETDAATETETRKRWPLPANTQQVLQLILATGNTSFTDDQEHQVAGTPDKPGPILPCDGWDLVAMTMNGLLGGERISLMTTRAGRHFAQHGNLATFDNALTDVNLLAWGRGEIDYLEQELLEAIDAFHHEIPLTRAEALIVLLKKGVVTPAEARRDV